MLVFAACKYQFVTPCFEMAAISLYEAVNSFGIGFVAKQFHRLEMNDRLLFNMLPDCPFHRFFRMNPGSIESRNAYILISDQQWYFGAS